MPFSNALLGSMCKRGVLYEKSVESSDAGFEIRA